MEHRERVEAVERELGAFVAAVEAGPLDAPVPSCPDWTVADLATHVAQFLAFWDHVLTEGDRPEGGAFDGTEPPDDLLPRVTGLGTAVLGHLHGSDPATPAWTWLPTDGTVGFIARRCAHELAMHRVDAQLARGGHEPIDADLAVDGIEEVFVLLQRPKRPAPRATGQTLHLHGTDHPDGEWLITLGPERIEVVREHAKGDLAVRAAVSDLQLLAYQRPTIGQITTFGDEAVLDAFHREFTF